MCIKTRTIWHYNWVHYHVLQLWIGRTVLALDRASASLGGFPLPIPFPLLFFAATSVPQVDSSDTEDNRSPDQKG